MCPLGVTARESRIRDASAYLRELALNRAQNRIRAGSEPASRSTPDPSQVQMQIKIRMQIQIQHTVDGLLCYSGSFVGQFSIFSKIPIIKDIN